MKNKLFAMLMLVVILAQVLGQTAYNTTLVASEISSQIDSEQSLNSETHDSEQVTSEDQVENVSESTSKTSSETTSSEVDSEALANIDQDDERSLNSSNRIDGSDILRKVAMSPGDIYEGDDISNTIEIAFDPSDSGTVLNDGEKWDKVTVTLDPELQVNDSFGIEITQASPNIITGWDTNTLSDGSTEITFDINQDAVEAGGQTVGIVFISNVINGTDLAKYSINVEACGDQGTCYEGDASITYHDPASFEITKEMTSPKYASAGKEITYEITMSTIGTGEISGIPQIIDSLPDNVEYVSSTPEGVYDGSTVIWDWTDEDIAARTKTVEITIIANDDFYAEGDTLTNTADAFYNDEVVDEAESNEDIYPGFFINLPDGSIEKNGSPTTNPDGATTAPGDQIFWNFDNINYEGNATLNNYTLTDVFPQNEDGSDMLLVDEVCYGAVKEEPNTFVNTTVTYKDGSTKILTIDMDTNGDNCISIPDEANITRGGVESITWNYGNVILPFKIVGAGVNTTISNTVEAGTAIDNNLDADYDIPQGGDGKWDICPPPYISYDNGDGTTECRDEDGSQITLTDGEVYGIFHKEISDTTGDIEDIGYGDKITYKLTLGNAKASPGNLLVDGIYDVLPEGLEYIEGSTVISSDIPDSTEESYDSDTNILSYSFLKDREPLAIAPGETYTIEFQAKVTSKQIEQLINDAYLVSNTPDNILNGSGTDNTTEPIDFDGDGNFENVYVDNASVYVNKAKVEIEKSIENTSKLFVPSNIDETRSTVNYQFMFSNKDNLIGNRYAPITNPVIVDTLPNKIKLDESSLTFDYSHAPSITGQTIDVSNDGMSSPIDGDGQVVTFSFEGVLNPSEYIIVNYNADIKDYATGGTFKNTVEFKVDDKNYYSDNSTFTADATGLVEEIASQSIKKTASTTEASIGEIIEYTVEVENTGTMPLTDVTFIDDIPHKGIVETDVNTILAALPKVVYIERGGEPVEEEVNFKVTYTNKSGNSLTVTLSQGMLESFVIENEVENITSIEAVLPVTLYPGDVAELIFDVTTPISGDGSAQVGDKVQNTAHFTSTPVKSDGSTEDELDNDSNTVETTIVGPQEGEYTIGDFVYFDLDNNGKYDEEFDKPAANSQMQLYNSSGDLVAVTTTDSNGYYAFSALAPDNYTVKKQTGYFDTWYQVYPEGSSTESLSQDAIVTDSNNLDVDFRIVPASIIGTVYYDGYDADTSDSNYYDSTYDLDNEEALVTHDSKVAESKVELYDESNNLLETTTTEDGIYAFYNLKAGTYNVKITPIITSSDGKQYLLTAKSDTTTITLDRGEVANGFTGDHDDLNFGYIEPVTVDGTVWYDGNVNDEYDSGENTSSDYPQNRNLKVELVDDAGNPISYSVDYSDIGITANSPITTTTDNADGTYNFALLPGDYKVKVDYTTETPNPIHGYDNILNSSFTENSDGLSSTLTNVVKASTPDTAYGDNNLGIYQNGYIEGNVYEDLNYNGEFDDTDTAASNISISLLDIEGNPILDESGNPTQATVDSDGDYQFTEVDAALTYQLQMTAGNSDDMFIDYNTPVSGTTDTKITVDSDSSTALYTDGTNTVFGLKPDQSLIDVDGSVYQYAQINDTAFIDMDGDGQQDYINLDQYKSDIIIHLTGTDGMGYDVNRQATTDSNGSASFDQINPGKSYKIAFEIPDGYKVTWKDRGDNATDSDINRSSYDSYLDLYAKDSKKIDGGMYQPVDISGYVFTDTDRNGYLTEDDTPASNTTVTIKYDSATDPTTVNVTTDSNGYFELTGVEPGNYSTSVTLPDSSYEYSITGINGSGVIANDVKTDGTTATQLVLSGGSNDQDFDTGYNQRTSISGKIYLDTNTNLTWDSSELLIDDISVSLYDKAGSVVATATTDTDGYYEFTGLEPGEYHIEASTVNYAHYENEDEVPSIQADAKTPNFTAYSNTAVENVDGALTINGDTTHYLISDYVWEDTNYNNIQDSSESGISDAIVTLLDASGNPLTYTDSYPDLGINSGDVVSTTTDNNGNYLLIAEGAGDYQVQVNTGDKYYLAETNIGSDDTIDSDFMADGTDTYVGTTDITVDRDTRDLDVGASDKGTISGYVYNDENSNNIYDLGIDKTIGKSQVGLFTNDGDTDLDDETLIETVKSDSDGYYQFTDLEAGHYLVKYENLTPKNAFWLHEADGTLYLDNSGYEAHRDINLSYGQDLLDQNAGQSNQSILTGIVFEDMIADGVYTSSEDTKLSGVQVTMYNADDGSIAINNVDEELTTTTNSSGQYIFNNIIPGDYYIEFTAPAGFVSSEVIPSGAETSSNNDAQTADGVIKTGTITVEEDKGYLTYSDAALYEPLEISGYFYDDYNIDGKYTDGLDQPIANGNVSLVNDDTDQKISMATDTSGFYQFKDVVPANYHLEFDTSGYDVISKLGTDNTAFDNDLNQDSTTDSIRYVSGNKYDVENDAAVYNLVNISGYIYEDMNNDGYYQVDGEKGITTGISLYDADGLVETITTNTDGSYQFTDLTPGDYYVQVDNPGNEFTVAKQGNNASGIASELDDSLIFKAQTLYSGHDDTINFDGGYYQLTDISGQVFFDSDTNLILNDSEFGITDLDISLYAEDDTIMPVATTTTDSDGNYQFKDIIPGNYIVRSSSTVFGDYEDMPEDYKIKSDMQTPVFTAYSNTSRDNVDGAVTQGTDVYLIGNYVWEDTNYNGLQDNDESPYSGMQVELIDIDGNVVDTYTTTADGKYYFFAPKGDYTLSFTAGDDYHFTKEVLLNNDIDSNVPEATENISTVDITVDSNDLSYDAGVRKDGNISGRVYYDIDANGSWDQTVDKSNETRTVSLYSGSHLIETKEISLTQDGSQGTYNFTNLERGDYRLEFSDDTNKFWVQNEDGKLIFDNGSEGLAKRELSLEYGQTVSNQDAGYSTGASLAGFVYEDNDYDGTFSRYLSTPNNTDLPIANMEVKLLDNNSNVIATTTTSSTGFYSFGNLEPYQSYSTEITNKDDDSDGVDDFTVTQLGTASTEYTNDMISSSSIGTVMHILSDSEYNNKDYDGGLLEYANLSGYVYEDSEVNSTMDTTDKGLHNITVNLYDQDNKFIESTKTDSDGYYSFENIYPGYYYVEFELDGYEVSPIGKVATAFDNDIDASYKTKTINVASGTSDSVNFDAAVYKPVSVGGTIYIDGNANGVFDSVTEAGLGSIKVSLYNDQNELIGTQNSSSDGSFEFTNLLPDEYYTVVDTKDYLIAPLAISGDVTNNLKQDKTTDIQYVPSSASNYMDYDGGLYKNTDISGKIYLDTNADLTRQSDEWLIPDLNVVLLDGSGAEVTSTTTDSNGFYQFTDLTPGEYQVVADTTDYATYENEDETPSIQNDGQSPVFTALSATPVVNVDGALTIGGDDHHFIISDYVWEDTNYDGIQEGSEPAMSDVKVRLVDGSGNTLTYQDSYPGLGITAGDKVETTTDSNGYYMLIAEDSVEYTVETEASTDYYATGADTSNDTLDNDFTGVSGSTNIGHYNYTPTKDTTDVDSGYSEVGTIAGNVYDDQNLNFKFDEDSDLDVADIEVTLTTSLGKVLATTTTNSSGYYQFKDLEAGSYVVKFQSLKGLKGFYIPESDGSIILDNGGYEAHRKVKIAYGEDKLHENAGRSESLLLSGITYEDMIADGVYDPKEDILLPGVNADLMTLDKTSGDYVVAIDGIGDELSRVTNVAGQYMMGHIIPLTYKVRFSVPDGYEPTNVVAGDGATTKGNDAIVTDGSYETSIFELEEGHYYNTIADASYYKPVTIEGNYFEDMDTDGVYDEDLDNLLSGYDVNLIDSDGNVVDTVQTNSSGHYLFADVVPGYYQVQFDNSEFDAISKLGTANTSLANDLTQDGMTAQGRYTSGNTYSVENDGAVYNYASLEGYAYEDDNNNGLFDAGETGLRSKVTVYDNSGNAIKSAYSNHNGYYEFTDLIPGKYYVSFEAPDSSYHPANSGDNSLGIASEINNSYTTPKQSLYSSQRNTVDFDGGMYRLGSISGQVFWDANEDLDVNGYDFGIWDVTVSLYRAQDLKSKATPTPIATTVTDSEGNYVFENLVPGDYVVKVDPSYFGYFEDMPGDYQVKDTGHTELFTVVSGTVRTSVDAAITRGLGINYIGDYVWEDVDGDGKQETSEPAYANATVNLIDSDGNVIDTTTTDENGYYDFFANSGEYKVEFVVADDYHFTKTANADSELDSDAIETTENTATTEVFDGTYNRRDIDAGVRRDANISGRVYYDKDASGTYNNGDESTEPRTVSLYKTGKLLRSDQLIATQEIDTNAGGVYNFTNLTEGNYRLEFSDDTNRFWIENSDGLLEFDNNTEAIATRNVKVKYGQTLTDQDAGYAYGAAISGYMFNDDNYNGKFESDERPESNVKIDLYNKDDEKIATATTDSDGHYGFTNLEPNKQYYVIAGNKDVNNDGVYDYTVTAKQVLNSKFDNDMKVTDGNIQTAKLELNDAEVNDIDFDGGIVYKTHISGYAYNDKDINSTYSAGDQMLSEVNVSLINKADEEVATTVTDSNGYYQFDNIDAGYYSVKFELEGYNVSPKGTENTEYDNDINKNMETSTIDVKAKVGNDLSFDAAVYTNSDLAALEKDDSKNGSKDETISMKLGKTGSDIIMIIIGLLVLLGGLFVIKRKMK